MPKNYQLLIFDWDGTLMDSAARIVSSFHAAIAEVELAPLPDQAIREVIGLGLTEAVRHLYPGESEARRDQLRARYRHHYLFANTIPTPLFPGAAEVLQQLEAQGYLLAVATGKSRAGLARALEETGLGPLFAATRTAEETVSKPEPQMLWEILEELDGHPETALMIGDSEYDMEMARRIEMDCLAVNYGVHDSQRLMTWQPRGCLNHIGELPDWLRTPNP